MIWINLMLFIVIMFLLIYVNHLVLRHFFKIQNENKSYIVHNTHRKIEKYITSISVLYLLIALYFIMFQNYSRNIFFIGLIVYVLFTESVKAYFVWKDSSQPKYSILVITDMLIVVIALILVSKYEIFV